LWPSSAGSGSPSIGAPLGQNLITGVTVCGDPASWFTRAHLIANPSMYVQGKPGTGKSTLVDRMLLYLASAGVTPLVLGDLKPDYTATVAWLGGQVIPVGCRLGGINVLDPGEMEAAAQRIGGLGGSQLRAEAYGRCTDMPICTPSGSAGPAASLVASAGTWEPSNRRLATKRPPLTVRTRAFPVPWRQVSASAPSAAPQQGGQEQASDGTESVPSEGPSPEQIRSRTGTLSVRVTYQCR
jgi:hypothetical protein